MTNTILLQTNVKLLMLYFPDDQPIDQYLLYIEIQYINKYLQNALKYLRLSLKHLPNIMYLREIEVIWSKLRILTTFSLRFKKDHCKNIINKIIEIFDYGILKISNRRKTMLQ